ncbi:MAG: hypothetical protein EXX96DRAFT_614918 [Benjaminiella poitrasii]|nr:MAG: hypothetical protein EXX96DRAFT_614918 [Benjaminiella poitrasii]
MTTCYSQSNLSTNNTLSTLYNTKEKDMAPSSNNNLKPLDLSHGQCSWCGKYGHNRGRCPLLK